jgi:hypothetical protein
MEPETAPRFFYACSTLQPAHMTPPDEGQPGSLVRAARFPNLKALAWSGDELYASRGYHLLRARFPQGEISSADLSWASVGSFSPAWWRNFSSKFRLSSRLVRDGFHALTVLPSGGFVAAVPRAIVTLRAGENQFRPTHHVTRGTRPLHITAVPGGAIFWGEYFDNPSRDEVHIYASGDSGATWNVAYTFPQRAIRHVHNVVYDQWEDCLWVLTGDDGDECRILRASSDFSRVDVVLQGNQQARAVALVPAEEGVYFSSDTPLEPNSIYLLGRQGKLSQLSPISSSSIYGCRVGRDIYFSTMVEPSSVNTDRHVRIYGSRNGREWQSLVAWRKDPWPMGLFQYGNAFLPDGNNTTQYLAVTTVAVEADDMATSLYRVAL